MWKIKIKKINLDDILLFILLWLPIYQDSKLYYSLGSFGHAPIAIVSLFIFIYCVILKKVKQNRYSNQLYILLAIMILISMVSTVLYMFINNVDSFYNENLFFKFIKGCMYFTAIVCYIVSFISLTNDRPKILILKQFRNIFIFLSTILVIEYFTLPSAFSFLHAIRSDNYYRIRLLTSESSWTTTIIITYFILSVAYCYEKRSKKQLIFMILLFIMFAITTTSKSFIALTLICLFLFGIYNMKKILQKTHSIQKKKILIAIIIISMLLISGKVISKLDVLISYDIKNSTSISTRLYSFYCGSKMIINNPIGYGTSIYLPYLRESYYQNLEEFNKYEWTNLSEITDLINSESDSSLSIKSGVLQYTLYWGIIGTIIFYKFLYGIYKRLNNLKNCSMTEINLYKACLVTLILFITFVSSFDYKYEIWSFIAYLIYIEVENEKRREEK